jgi:hypothetical protein
LKRQRPFLLLSLSHFSLLEKGRALRRTLRRTLGVTRRSVSLKAPFENLSDVNERFASALIQLTYSNAAWFVNDLGQAEQYAAEAAKTFEAIETVKYRERALTIGALLHIWHDLELHQDPQTGGLDEGLAKGVLFLAGRNSEAEWFRDWFRRLRPSVAAGILQFRIFSETPLKMPDSIDMPPLLHSGMAEPLQWESNQVGSLDEMEMLLRRHIGAPEKNRIPLWAD